jgi:hypothetical protein
LECRLEVNQPIASRDFEEAIAQVRLNQPPLARDGRFLKFLLGEDVGVEVHRLLAVILQPRDHLAEILSALVAVQLRHVDDGRSQHRIQPRIDGEQVRAVDGEQLQFAGIREIQSARNAGQQQA